jgi:hypothetical protein
LLQNAERLKDHAIAMAKEHERPFQYLSSNMRKEDTARKLPERDAIEEGLACIFSIHLDALAAVDDPTNAKRDLDRVTTPKKDAAGRRLARALTRLRATTPSYSKRSWPGSIACAFTNRDIRAQLASTLHLRPCQHDSRKQSAKVSRTFRRFHAHGLIAKVPQTRRWRVTRYGRHVMGTSLYLQDHHFPQAYPRIAA